MACAPVVQARQIRPYVAPEVATGQLCRLEPAADVYSFGVVLLCLLIDPDFWDGALVCLVGEQVKSGNLAGMQQLTASEWPREDAMELCQLAVRCSLWQLCYVL